jgi:hypothetical protein
LGLSVNLCLSNQPLDIDDGDELEFHYSDNRHLKTIPSLVLETTVWLTK